MKNTQICPKCESSHITKIPGKVGSYGAGNNIIIKTFKAVKVTRYLCDNCGFSEEWIEDQKDIQALKEKYSD